MRSKNTEWAFKSGFSSRNKFSCTRFQNNSKFNENLALFITFVEGTQISSSRMAGGMKLFEIRYLEEHEKGFLLEMLYESIHMEKEKKPPLEELLNTYELKKYHQNWGRKGDKALIAVDNTGTPAGAVWYRLFSGEERGYGYVNDDTPEIGIAIKKEARGIGLGTKLMHSIIEEAKESGYKELSLSVDVDNSNAVDLYLGLGFVEVEEEGTSITMLLNTNED